MSMGRIPGFSPAEKAVPKRSCRDCWSDRVSCTTFSPDHSQPIRRCLQCWLAYYLPKWKARE